MQELQPYSLFVFGKIFSRCLSVCGLQEFGKERAYFDYKNPVHMRQYNISVLCGYKASIEIFNNRVLLCSEIANRIINDDTVLRCISDILHREGMSQGKETIIRELIGATVITT
jgi:hypothetical protein